MWSRLSRAAYEVIETLYGSLVICDIPYSLLVRLLWWHRKAYLCSFQNSKYLSIINFLLMAHWMGCFNNCFWSKFHHSSYVNVFVQHWYTGISSNIAVFMFQHTVLCFMDFKFFYRKAGNNLYFNSPFNRLGTGCGWVGIYHWAMWDAWTENR